MTRLWSERVTAAVALSPLLLSFAHVEETFRSLTAAQPAEAAVAQER